MFQPAFGCCKHPKAGPNTQQRETQKKGKYLENGRKGQGKKRYERAREFI